MGRKKSYLQFLEKSIEATLAALDSYNRPFSVYKTETFAILMTNAWELLLKAKWILDNGNDKKSIYIKTGRKYKRNRSGNYMTVNLQFLLEKLRQQGNSGISNNVYNNVLALIEIRDNAVHFKLSPATESIAYQIFAASVHNFYFLSKNWFKDYKELIKLKNLTIKPLSIDDYEELKFVNANEEKLYKYVKRLVDLQEEDRENGLYVAAEIKVKFVRVKNEADVTLTYNPNDSKAVPLKLSEEEWLERYPWTYNDLISKLKARYSDFKRDKQFYALKRKIEPDPEKCGPYSCYTKYCRIRFLDPKNPQKSSKKKYYSPNVIEYFDKYYTVKDPENKKP